MHLGLCKAIKMAKKCLFSIFLNQWLRKFHFELSELKS